MAGRPRIGLNARMRPTLPSYAAQVPYGATARRLEWDLLPPTVRRLVECRLGSPVVATESVGSGFTPGFASTLTCEDGTLHFVKAASMKAQRAFAEAYREEARKLRRLPADLPVPRLRWTHEDDRWVVLGLEHVDGRVPRRPWAPADLEDCLDTLEVLADRLTPPPLPLPAFADEFAECPAYWDSVRTNSPAHSPLDLLLSPGLDAHRAEAAALAARYREVTAGDTLVHTDPRDDNFLIAQGRALLCDWNWPTVGAPWIDTVLLLVAAAGDGADADALLASRRLTREVDPEHVDVLLALVGGYFLERRSAPVPTSSPFLRVHQAWYAAATWSWLAARRGWS
jgi:hypothetical protein